MNIDVTNSKISEAGTKEEKESLGLDANNKENTLVLLEFTDIDDANYCHQFNARFKSIDIESGKPIVQIGNRFYSGEYTNNLGTYLFFEEEEGEQQQQQSTKSSEPPAAEGESEAAASTNGTATPAGAAAKSEYKYTGKSFKKLVLTRLFVEEKRKPLDEASKNESA